MILWCRLVWWCWDWQDTDCTKSCRRPTNVCIPNKPWNKKDWCQAHNNWCMCTVHCFFFSGNECLVVLSFPTLHWLFHVSFDCLICFYLKSIPKLSDTIAFDMSLLISLVLQWHAGAVCVLWRMRIFAQGDIWCMSAPGKECHNVVKIA